MLHALLGLVLVAQVERPEVQIYQSERLEVGVARTSDSLPRLLYVALPPSYRDSILKRYPVVYVLDGDGLWGLTTGIVRLLLLRNEIPEVLVVGVAWGISFPETSPFRWRDFTPTAVSSRPGAGHAAELLSYLEREGVPLVDSMYRTVRGDRTLVGQSRAGLFALYTLYERPALFGRLVVGSPEVIFDDKYLLRRDSAFAVSNAPLPRTLYIAVGQEELTRPGGAAIQEFTSRLKARGYKGLKMFAETLPGETHVSAPAVTITHGLKAVLNARGP
jgi:hypothetical protein